MKYCSPVILLLLALLFAACKGEEHRQCVIVSGMDEFRDGDLLLRCGSGMESHAVTIASNDVYSHVGILWFDKAKQQWMAIHAVPGEAPEGEEEYLKCEPINDFFSSMRAERGAWARVKCTDQTAAAAALYCLSKVKAKVVFDNEYNLQDTTQLYCTELIYQAYLHQDIDLTNGQRELPPPLFSSDTDCIYPSTILQGGMIDFVKKMESPIPN